MKICDSCINPEVCIEQDICFKKSFENQLPVNLDLSEEVNEDVEKEDMFVIINDKIEELCHYQP